MRALAAERDKSEVPSAVDENSQPVKLKNKKKKVAHIVDKMLFNYRNIGKWPLKSLVLRIWYTPFAISPVLCFDIFL